MDMELVFLKSFRPPKKVCVQTPQKETFALIDAQFHCDEDARVTLGKHAVDGASKAPTYGRQRGAGVYLFPLPERGLRRDARRVEATIARSVAIEEHHTSSRLDARVLVVASTQRARDCRDCVRYRVAARACDSAPKA